MKDKQDYLKTIVLFFSLISLETFENFGISSGTIKVLRLALGLLIIALLSSKLITKQNKAQNAMKKTIEAFDIKFSTYIVASPDDVASHLTDISTRKAWDPNLR